MLDPRVVRAFERVVVRGGASAQGAAQGAGAAPAAPAAIGAEAFDENAFQYMRQSKPEDVVETLGVLERRLARAATGSGGGLRDVSSYFCGTLVRLSANNRAKEKRASGGKSPRANGGDKGSKDGDTTPGAGGKRGGTGAETGRYSLRECVKRFDSVSDASEERDATAWLWRCGGVALRAPKLFAAIEQRATAMPLTHAAAHTLLFAESPQGRQKLKR